MKLPQNCLMILAVSLSVVIAKRRRVPFMNCPAMKSNSDLLITKSARSRIECSKFCLDDPQCLSASYCKTSDGYTCELSGSFADGSCTGFVPAVDCIQTAFVDPCENGGTFFAENRTCQCLEGFFGDYCHRLPRDCIETKQEYGTFYFIEPLNSHKVFRWMCPSSTTHITYIAVVVSNKTYPYSMQQFKDGIVPVVYGILDYVFCGLEFLHQLTNQGMYDMSVFLNSDLPNGKLWYRNFRVDSEANGYAMHWDHVELDPKFPSSYQYLDGFGGAGDATKNLNGARFGAIDNDINGCVQDNKAGWWYNPLGCTALKFDEAGWSWPTDRNGTVETESLKGVFMMIEPVFWYTEDDLVL